MYPPWGKPYHGTRLERLTSLAPTPEGLPQSTIWRFHSFVLAYDEHDTSSDRWAYDGSPLKAA